MEVPYILHAAVWMLLLAVPGIMLWDHTFFGLSAKFFVLTTLYHIGLFYCNAFFLYPRLLNNKPTGPQ